MKIRKVLALILAAVLSLSLTACGSKTGTDDSTGGSTDGSKVIEFWSIFTGGDGMAMDAIVNAYNATNPEYTVKHVMVDQNDLYTRMPLLTSSQEGVPDLVINHVDRIEASAKADMYLPLDSYIAANGKIKGENYVPAAWDPGEVDGVRYGVPLDLHSYVCYYNKDLVEQYCPNVLDDGVVTFDEVASFADTAAADGVYTYAVTWARCEILSWYYQLGGKLTENGTDPTLNNPTFQRVFEDFADAYAKKWTTQDGDQPNNLFTQGKLIFLPEGTWMRQTVEGMGVNYGETYMISYDAQNPLQWASSHQFVIPKNDNMTDEKAAAIMDFINFVGENSYEWANYGQIPAAKAVLNDSRVNDLPQKFLIENANVMVISDYLYFGAVLEALDAVAYEIPFGRLPAADGLAQMQQQVETTIKNQ